MKGMRAAVIEALRECVSELEAYESPSDPFDSHNVRLGKARAVLAELEKPEAQGARDEVFEEGMKPLRDLEIQSIEEVLSISKEGIQS